MFIWLDFVCILRICLRHKRRIESAFKVNILDRFGQNHYFSHSLASQLYNVSTHIWLKFAWILCIFLGQSCPDWSSLAGTYGYSKQTYGAIPDARSRTLLPLPKNRTAGAAVLTMVYCRALEVKSTTAAAVAAAVVVLAAATKP